MIPICEKAFIQHNYTLCVMRNTIITANVSVFLFFYVEIRFFSRRRAAIVHNLFIKVSLNCVKIVRTILLNFIHNDGSFIDK